MPVAEATKGGVELTAMKAPEKSDPAALEVVKAVLNAHTANKPSDVNKFKTVKFLRGGFIRSLEQQTLPQAWRRSGQRTGHWRGWFIPTTNKIFITST